MNALRLDLRLSLLALLLALLLLVGCRENEIPEPDEAQASGVTPPGAVVNAQEAIFEDRTATAGLDFRHHNGMAGDLTLLEIMGAGAGLLDYDGDGDLDLYLVQGGSLPESLETALRGPPAGGPSDRLLRNEWVPSGELRFTDVTEAAGVGARGYGMGVATGDADGDGLVDLYVTNYGPNQLLRNRGDGTFEDVTAASGTGLADAEAWSSAALFTDFDGDGWPDLLVVSYVDFRPEKAVSCRSKSGLPDYCLPTLYDALPDRLLRSRGRGPEGVTFEDVTRKVGLAEAPGSGLGAVAADFDGNGRMDLYVANDNLPNRLWMGRPDGTFSDEAMLAGAALSREGQPEGSMGLDAADFDGDGDDDLFLTHLSKETHTLYRNDGRGLFTDRTRESGLATPSLPYTSFGTRGLDFDGDGWLDLLVVSGEVRRIEEQLAAGAELPLAQADQLLRNRGDGTFEDVTSRAGGGLAEPRVSRGAAFGDLDNDGDTDVILTENHGPARLLTNRGEPVMPWLGLRALEASPRGALRDALGARVGVFLDDGRVLWRRVATDGSYLSAHDPRVLVGLGEARASKVRVVWPGGAAEEFPAPSPGSYQELRRGEGKAVER